MEAEREHDARLRQRAKADAETERAVLIAESDQLSAEMERVANSSNPTLAQLDEARSKGARLDAINDRLAEIRTENREPKREIGFGCARDQPGD